MALTAAQLFGLGGIAASLVGVIMLFRYGMPYRVPSTNGDQIVTEQADPEGLKEDARYRRLGQLGLLLVVLGTALQAGAVLIRTLKPWNL